MEFEAIGGAASIALLGSGAFALTARGWIALSHGRGRPPFSHRLLPESAQRFRDEFDLLGSKQSVLLASALVFAVLFAFAWISGSARLLSGAGGWLVGATGMVVVAGITWPLYRFFGIALRRRHIALQRYANIAVGQMLEKVTGSLNRVFHDVACGDEIIDHVLVGQKGVYAIFVIPRRGGRHNKVRARDGRLWFAQGRQSLPLDGFVATSDKLARLLRKPLRNPVRVRTVVVVPGWEIEEQSGEQCLVVNERSLVMLRGWTDRSEYLMNDEVEALHEFLVERAVGARKHGE